MSALVDCQTSQAYKSDIFWLPTVLHHSSRRMYTAQRGHLLAYISRHATLPVAAACMPLTTCTAAECSSEHKHSMTAITGAYRTTLKTIIWQATRRALTIEIPKPATPIACTHPSSISQQPGKHPPALTAAGYWSAQGIYKQLPVAHRKIGHSLCFAHKASIHPNSLAPHTSELGMHTPPPASNRMLRQLRATTSNNTKILSSHQQVPNQSTASCGAAGLAPAPP